MFQVALAASLVALTSVRQAPIHDDLEPRSYLTYWFDAPEPYYQTVGTALLGEDALRECEMLVLPSFEPEWAVYLVHDEDPYLERVDVEDARLPPTIVFKRPKASVWHSMCDELERESTDGSFSFDRESQSRAIGRLSIEVDRFAAHVGDATAAALRSAWEGMLRRVRYPEKAEFGRVDGVSYHAAHTGPDGDRWCGETWSPDEGTRTRALVELAEAMRDLAESPPAHRPAKEVALVAAARALAERLEQLKVAEHGR